MAVISGVISIGPSLEAVGPDVEGKWFSFQGHPGNGTDVGLTGVGQVKADAYPVQPGVHVIRRVSNLKHMQFYTDAPENLCWLKIS